MKPAIGLVELNSVAKGIETSDAMIKVAGIELVEAYPVCPGKYIILVTGVLGDVQPSVGKGLEIGKDSVIDSLIIPNLHEQVIPAIRATTKITELDALGIIETFSVASCIVASDAGVKAAEINLIEIRLAKGLGGKSFVTMTGEVGAVRSAVDAACDTIKEDGVLISRVVIPKPHKDLRKTIL